MLSRIFIARPRLAAVIAIVLVLAGLICLPRLPVAEYPELAPPQIHVAAAYSGAGAQVVADTVALPLEDGINGIEDLQYFSSTSDDSGSYSCSITFKPGVDADMALVNTQNAVKRVESKLPAEVVAHGVTVEKRSADMLAMFTFITDGSVMSQMELANYVNSTVVDAVNRVDGVSSAEVMGDTEYAMRIWLDPLRAAALGLSAGDVVDAVKAQNVQAAVGGIGSEMGSRYLEYKITAQGRLRTAEEFGDIVVRSEDKRVVRLRDVARVELGSDSYSGGSTFNGVESVTMDIYRNTDTNALDVVGRVREVLDEMSSRFPPGVRYAVSYDPTAFIVISLREIAVTLLAALLLVVGITYAFLQDWRATLIPAAAIPVSLLATFPVMLALGYSINVLTMFGLVLVIGSLVDDAIVVVENALALMERENLSAAGAAAKSMEQITGAVVATTLVTLACYAPLAFYGGMVGNIYRQFSVVMCVALCFSALVALTLSPALCAFLLRKPSAGRRGVFRLFNAGLGGAKAFYLGGAGLLVRRLGFALALFGCCLAGIYLLQARLPASFIPQEDRGNVRVELSLPAGAALERTEEALAEFRAILADVPGVKSFTTISGRGRLFGVGENYATVSVTLDDWDERAVAGLEIGDIIADIQERARDIASARVTCYTPPAIMGLGKTGGVSFMLSGEGDVDAAELSALAGDFAQKLSDRPEALSAMTTYDAGAPQLRLDIDREKAETLRVPVDRIFASLQRELSDYYVNDFNFRSDTFDVVLQSGAAFRGAVADIQDIQVAGDDGVNVPLGSLGTIRHTVGPRQIFRFNEYVSAEINAEAAPGVATGELMRVVETLELPPNFHIEWTGLSYQERENQGQIAVLMVLALLFAYLFLVGQYESWTMPLPVMLSVAFAILGALLGLWLAGLSVSIYAQLGLVMLVGLAAKNAILMVEFSRKERARGVPVADAAVNGASLRFRAVLMTAWSFLFGVFPLVVASGAGAASRRAIGVTTFSGMLLATLVGIFFIPALYAACQRLQERISAAFGKK